MSAMTPAAARKLAGEHEESDHELGAKRGRALRQWAHAVGQAKRRSSAGMSTDAEDAWGRAESHRQHLADMGVEVPTRTEITAAPSSSAPAPARAPARSSSGGRAPARGGSPRGRSSSAPSLPSVPGSSTAGSIAKPIILGTLGLILFYRLVDTAGGGPKVFSMGVSGVSKLLDLFVLPVDPFRPSLVTGSVTTPAANTDTSSPTAAGAAVPGVPHH